MTSKPQPTRASSRTKAPVVVTAPTPAPVRTTRAKAAAGSKTQTIVPPSNAAPVTFKKPVTKKLILDMDNAAEVKKPVMKKNSGFPKPVLAPVRTGAASSAVNTDREPIMAYLRIRPQLRADDSSSLPYLETLSKTSVRMTDPNRDNNSNKYLHRLSTATPSSLYTFSHIFPPETHQSDFFTKTTLPLVRDLLDGQNALLFTYGVTNSGKTFTVQGGTKEGSAGILPRTLDVIFNSIEGMHSDGRYRPVRLQGIELAEVADTDAPNLDVLDVPTDEPALAAVLAEHLAQSNLDSTDIDSTVLKLDRNYEYSVWLSYAEVYNEKAYDLLEAVSHEDDTNTKTTKSGWPRPAQYGSNQPFPLVLTRKALSVKLSPPSDAYESGAEVSAGKYIAGLRQFRVNSASEAKALVKLGQLHRRVFGTLANSQSSRSHGLVTIKVVRGHNGERDDPTTLQVSRLTLVDLAGSERTKHTQTTGDRLIEAGNINKSLMVLGQCMEVMRANQKRLAQSLAGAARTDTRDIKRGLAVVPFRHSKLTEVLMDYFVGDGRAVMIVNVNPYDTGYDENSHVMKFAALAREVYTTPAYAPIQRPPSPTKPTTGPKTTQPGRLRTSAIPGARQVTLSVGGHGKKYSETHLEVLEEDAEVDDIDDDDDEPINPLVDALFDEVESLRIQLFESEMRCATIEAETREEVMREMEERMRSVERMYTRRLMSEAEQNELKNDKKIDMLHQSGLFGKQTLKTRESSILEDEEDIDSSMVLDEEGSGQDIGSETESESQTETEFSKSPSPLSAKGKGREIRQSVPSGPVHIPLPSECSDDDGIQSDGDTSTEMSSQANEDDADDTDDIENISEDDGDWSPLHSSKNVRVGTESSLYSASDSSIISFTDPSAEPSLGRVRAPGSRVSKLAQEMDDLSIGDSDSDLSAYILTNKKSKKVILDDNNDSDGRLATFKKKKRQIGKKLDDVEQTPLPRRRESARKKMIRK